MPNDTNHMTEQMLTLRQIFGRMGGPVGNYEDDNTRITDRLDVIILLLREIVEERAQQEAATLASLAANGDPNAAMALRHSGDLVRE